MMRGEATWQGWTNIDAIAPIGEDELPESTSKPAIYTTPSRRPNRETRPVRTLFVLPSAIVDRQTCEGGVRSNNWCGTAVKL